MDTEPEEDQAQRRIELSSKQDLAYLVANVRRAAAEYMAEAFPQIEGQASDEDELRNQIEVLVDEYINQTFTLASPNLSINGLPVQPESFLKDPSLSHRNNTGAPQEGGDGEDGEALYEPYDAAKRQRVADLVAQEEKLLEDVAALKRAVPAAVAAEHARALDEAASRDEEALQAALARASSSSGTVPLELPPLARQEGVEAGFKRAVGGLARLKREMPSVVARMERARVAGEYVVSDAR
ncbi:hypothetical protein K4F52_002041 [Lecanicillium sp. MT-2017a]|nr:hypothetical protein K4F52_002041 [Lecanicillium sp. MT-2017a]